MATVACAFANRLSGRLEVAIGLETADPAVLARLNKRMTRESFARAADFLARHGIELRAFILLKPPFAAEDDYVEWACRSIDCAREHGATVCSSHSDSWRQRRDGGARPPVRAADSAGAGAGDRIRLDEAGLRVFAISGTCRACSPARVRPRAPSVCAR
jgi:hypothetical protein